MTGLPVALGLAPELVITALLVAANGFFVATEFAIVRVRPTQVRDLLEDGALGARSLKHATDHIDNYLAACQLGITLASLGLGVVGERAFHHLLEPMLGDGALVGSIALASALAFLIITMLHVVLGELSPKSLAIARTAGVSLFLAPLMRVFYLVTKPFVDFFNWLGNLVLKPFGVPPASETSPHPHSEEELRELVRESAQEGILDPEEQRFTEGVFTFGDRRVREIMVPRREIDFVKIDESLEQISAHVVETPRTRLPVCEPEGLDHPVGVVHVKDLLAALTGNGEPELRTLLRDIPRVSESTHVDEVLRSFRRDQQHLGLVLDEHGTTVGLVTLEDILEEIVGEIEDEFDTPGAELLWWEDAAGEGGEGTAGERGDGAGEQAEDGRAVSAEGADDREPAAAPAAGEDEQAGARVLVARGDAPTFLVAEHLGIHVPSAHEATIGGHLTETLGRVPEPGERIALGDVRAEIVEVDETRVAKVRMTSVRDAERAS